MNKQKILKISFSVLLNEGFVNISQIAKRTGLEEKKLYGLFSDGDKELYMDTVEYAGKAWVDKIKKEIAEKNDSESKLKTLAAGYTLGSKDYPESLSVYIDLWKIIKDNKDEYVKERLRNIYNYYISEFCNIVNEINKFNIKYDELRSFALFMTILSDMIHIQSLTLENNVDFESFKTMIEKITVAYFNGEPKI